MRELNLPGVAIEQSFVLSEEERYGADGSIRTDIILRKKDGDPLAVWDLKTGAAARMSSRRVAQIMRGILGHEAADRDIPIKIIRLELVTGLRPAK
jgi:hypothetical protein